MDTLTIALLAGLIFGSALLYSSVGHAGASGYLAAMALFGLAPDVMKPTALALNILVATIASVKYYRAGYFSWPIFWPFALTSVPFAFIGGGIALPDTAYKVLMGLVLLYAAYRLFQSARINAQAVQKPLAVSVALVIGAGIGLLSGLTGVGGGIFLSPVLLLTGWAETRQASGIAAVFILVNSTAGLLGNLASVSALPGAILIWAPFAVLGGWLGAEYGTRRLRGTAIRQLLSLVLAIAGVKMMLP